MNKKEFNNLRIWNIALKLMNNKNLSKNDIMFLYDFLNTFKTSNDSKNILKLINRLNKGVDLFNAYKHYLALDKIALGIDNIEKELNLILFNKKIESKKVTNAFNLIFNEKEQKKDKFNQLHKFIKEVNIFRLLDKIYSTNNDIILNKVESIKELYINDKNIIAFRIDKDLIKSNEHKFKNYAYAKIIIYHYDITKIYYIMNIFDLLDLNINYSYEYNNLLSYFLDYKFKKYYDIFNNTKKLNIAFQNMKTYNNVLVNQIKDKKDKKEHLRVNKSFKYYNEYYTFNSLLNDFFKLEYLSINLNDYFKQLDLELISIDNDNDYLSLLNKSFNFISDLYNLLDNDYHMLKNYVNSIKSDYECLKIVEQKTLKNITLINIEKVQIFKHIKEFDNLEYHTKLLNQCLKDRKAINNILNKLEFIINRYNQRIDNENYNKNYLEFEKLNKHNSKTNNKELEQVKNGTKNYCFCQSEYDTFRIENKYYFKVI